MKPTVLLGIKRTRGNPRGKAFLKVKT